MKIKYLSVIFLVLITSCGEKSGNPQAEKASSAKPPVQAESAGEIVNKYVDTLVTAKDKANKAAGALESKAGEENRTAQEIEKQ